MNNTYKTRNDYEHIEHAAAHLPVFLGRAEQPEADMWFAKGTAEVLADLAKKFPDNNKIKELAKVWGEMSEAVKPVITACTAPNNANTAPKRNKAVYSL